MAAELADMSVVGLTDEELDVAKLIGDVFRAFSALPQAHPSDLDEVIFHVHALDRIVLSRAAIRAHPERWQFK
jgi:hypothetical protein